MDDPNNFSEQTSDNKNILPDVVHSQQIPAAGAVLVDGTEVGVNAGHNIGEDEAYDVDDDTETISEHILSGAQDWSASEEQQAQGLLTVDNKHEKVLRNSPTLIPFTPSPHSENLSLKDPSKNSTSWAIDINADVNLISEETPVLLALSSELSKEATQDNKTHSLLSQYSEHYTPNESPRSGKYVDSLNEESSHKSNLSLELVEKSDNSENNADSLGKESSTSEEIIKLDIRGSGVPKFPFPSAKIIFGPPPEGGMVLEPPAQQMPVFPNLISPFLVGAGDSIKVEEVFDDYGQSKECVPEKSIESVEENMDSVEEFNESIEKLKNSVEKSIESVEKSIESVEKSLESDKLTDNVENFAVPQNKDSLSGNKIEENDLLVEEIVVEDELKEKDNEKQSIHSQTKSMPAEETLSFSTLTDYKTICEEYHVKVIIHMMCVYVCLFFATALLCILILLVTPMACFVLMIYQQHSLIYKNISKYYVQAN